MKRYRPTRILFSVFFILAFSFSLAQKQLVFLRNDKVIIRYAEGDRFKFKLKNKKWKEGFIYELTDFAVISSGLDTISFLSIDKVRIKRGGGINVSQGFGGLLFLGGLIYTAVDQANSLVGSTKGGFDTSNYVALALSGVGAAILFIKPRYKRVGRGMTIRAIDYRSLYYYE